jgi:hypothetical protein
MQAKQPFAHFAPTSRRAWQFFCTAFACVL